MSPLPRASTLYSTTARDLGRAPDVKPRDDNASRGQLLLFIYSIYVLKVLSRYCGDDSTIGCISSVAFFMKRALARLRRRAVIFEAKRCKKAWTVMIMINIAVVCLLVSDRLRFALFVRITPYQSHGTPVNGDEYCIACSIVGLIIDVRSLRTNVMDRRCVCFERSYGGG